MGVGKSRRNSKAAKAMRAIKDSQHNALDRCPNTGKRMFADQYGAKFRAPCGMRVYKCKFCGSWHITKQPKNG